MGRSVTVRLICALGLGSAKSITEKLSSRDPWAGGRPADADVVLAAHNPGVELLRRLGEDEGRVSDWARWMARNWQRWDGAEVPFAEMIVLPAVVADLEREGHTVAAVQVALLHDQGDRKHVGVRRLLKAWTESLGPTLPFRIHSYGLGVGFPAASQEQDAAATFSVLDERLATPADQGGVWTQDRVWGAERAFQAAALKEMLPPADSGVLVFVNGKSGSTLAKNLLQECVRLSPATLVSGVRWIPDGVGGGRFSTKRAYGFPAEPSHSRIQHLFSRAVQITRGTRFAPDEVIEMVGDDGLAGLLNDVGDGRQEISDIAWRMVNLSNQHDGPPFSACADLLARVAHDPSDPLATRLTELVAHWHRNRLWSINLVPEMVLHNEAHAQAVDRNVALMVEPLLRAGVLAPSDVYRLALAAWLHDWGHASADIPTRPIHNDEVRHLHGLLTKELLRGTATSDDRTNVATWHALSQEDAAWVGVLAAHHQGWTSCDRRRPTGSEAVLADRFCVPARSLLEDLEEIWELIPETRADGPTFARAQEMVALIRLADAADIGAHRVPHFDTVDVYLHMLLGIAEGRESDPESRGDARVGETESPHLKAYREFLCKQPTYFAIHGSVGGVYPVLQGTDHDWTLVPQVRPGRELLDDRKIQIDPLDVVSHDLNRELGLETIGAEDERKRPVREALQRLGIRVGDTGVHCELLLPLGQATEVPAMHYASAEVR